MKQKAIVGCLLGTAAGDSLGLPYEGLRSRRVKKMLGSPVRQRFIWGRGMISDDTEHVCFVAQSLITANGDVVQFQKRLAASLRWWMACVPAGIGKATLLSICKLWLGFGPERSGIFSAGNGPSMRSAILGIVFGDNHTLLKEYVRRSSQITHSDPKAYFGALAIALAANMSSQDFVQPTEFIHVLHNLLKEESAQEFLDLIDKAAQSADKNEPVTLFAQSIGSRKGISGYTYHTVPCVIQTWFRYPKDYPKAIREIIEAGGDTDTTAAILGAVIGAGVGKAGIPKEWLNLIIEWPRSVSWMEKLGTCLAAKLEGNESAQVKTPFYFLLPIRNLVFLILVLMHGFRRLLPPY